MLRLYCLLEVSFTLLEALKTFLKHKGTLIMIIFGKIKKLKKQGSIMVMYFRQAFVTKSLTALNGKIDTVFEDMPFLRVSKIISWLWSFYFLTFFVILSVSHENMKLQLHVKMAKNDQNFQIWRKISKNKKYSFLFKFVPQMSYFISKHVPNQFSSSYDQ